VSININKAHLIGYGILAGVVLLLFFLWHDTRTQDTAQQAILAKAVQDAQETIKEAKASIEERDKELSSQNAALEKANSDAKTSAQQAALISSLVGTQKPIIVQAPPPGQNTPPSGNLVVPAEDTAQLTTFVTKCKECDNTNKVLIQNLETTQSEVNSLITETNAQKAEITALKGGSRWHRFVKAVEYVGIGVGVGAAVSIAASH